nr:hypothetical protein [uncultured Acetobacter sp.]
MARKRKERKRWRHALLLYGVMGGGSVFGSAPAFAAEPPAASQGLDVPEGIARCDITTGRPVFCGAPYTGQAVLPQGGAFYHVCDVTLGTARFCSGLYTGRAVVRQGRGDYARCDLTMGRVTFCQGPYTGKAVIPQNAD